MADAVHLPLLEDDLAEPGVIRPAGFAADGPVPPAVVLCFFAEVIERCAARADAERIGTLRSARGEDPVLAVGRGAERVAVLHPGVGAPLAVGVLEEVVAAGGRTFVAVGGAGALLPDLVLGHPVVVGSALRDEGTSFHYAAPSRTIDADAEGISVLRTALEDAGADHLIGRTWTTDAFYRETPGRVARRIDEGCSVVEMEAAALIAACRFRGVRFAQLLYAGDSLAGPEWDHRGWDTAHDARQHLFELALAAALRLDALSR